MSEAAISKTSRKSSTPQLPVDYEVEDTGDGRLRVQVQAPSLTRVIAHPLFPYREEPTHPFLRPLRRLFVEGSPDLGRVWYILVSGGPRTFPGVLLAIVLTQGHEKAPAYVRGLAPHKLSVFAGWGSGFLTSCIQGGVSRKVEMPIDHYTYEERPNGVITYHLTSFRTPGKTKRHILKSRRLLFGNEHDLHLFRLGVRQPLALEPVGTFWARHRRLPHLTPERCRKLLEHAIVPRAPFIQLPEDETWSPGRYLDLNLILTDRGVEDVDYPIPPWPANCFVDGKVLPDAAMSMMVPLRLYDHLHLLLVWASRPGLLANDFVWYSRGRAAGARSRRASHSPP